MVNVELRKEEKSRWVVEDINTEASEVSVECQQVKEILLGKNRQKAFLGVLLLLLGARFVVVKYFLEFSFFHFLEEFRVKFWKQTK